MKSICTVQETQQKEKLVFSRGVTSVLLMNTVAKSVVSMLDNSKNYAIVCGKGNNGGDGYAVSLYLKNATVFYVELPQTESAFYYYQKCLEKGIKCIHCNKDIDFSEYDCIIDCIFGIGFRGEIMPEISIIIDIINRSKKPVFAMDIPSGLCADTGLGEKSIIAQKTFALGCYKPGHFLAQGKDCCGEVQFVDLGFAESECMFIEGTEFSQFIAKRKNYSHKGTYGYVAIMGGCKNYAGAIKLTNLACSSLYAGTGVVRLVVADDIFDYIAPHMLSSTLYSENQLDDAIKGISAFGIGCGWGRDSKNDGLLKRVFEKADCPLIIDADGLFVLKRIGLSYLKGYRAPIILTPHLGEFSRLIEKSVEEIERSPIDICIEFCNQYNVILLLKGPSTIITDGKITYILSRGSAGMATAGSGDVLTGVMTGVLGQKIDSTILSVAYATYLNGLSGELAEKEFTDIGMTSFDTASKIRDAIVKMRNV